MGRVLWPSRGQTASQEKDDPTGRGLAESLGSLRVVLRLERQLSGAGYCTTVPDEA